MDLAKNQILALEYILKIREDKKNLNDVLSTLPTNKKDINTNLIVDIVYGSQRYLGELEFYLNLLSRKKIKDNKLKYLLIIALYQLMHTNYYQYVVVNEVVKASLMISPKGIYKSFVNWILREFLRRKKELFVKKEDNLLAKYNFPLWWINKLKNLYPKNWHEILTHSQEHPPLVLRVNQRKTNTKEYLQILIKNGIDAKIIDDFAIRITHPIPVTQIPLFWEGYVSVQDYGAQYLLKIIDIKESSYVLDACSAPGGKTGLILEKFNCNLVALDINENRLHLVRDNLRRLGLSAQIIVCDILEIDKIKNFKKFNFILADVPCSASGVVKRNPDIKWNRTEHEIKQFSRKQLKILDKLWCCLETTGKIIYATCSIFKEENNMVISEFLAKHNDAGLQLEKQLLPDINNDGFYYALLQKN